MGRARWRRTLVVFCDATELWWLCFLKRGFRHCFVALGDGERWMTIDPLSHVTDIALIPGDSVDDLASIYRGLGLTVLETSLRIPPRRAAPWRPFTCVEAVKRILGVHAGNVVTPWQLYCFLSRNRDSSRNSTINFPIIGKNKLTSRNISGTNKSSNATSPSTVRPLGGRAVFVEH